MKGNKSQALFLAILIAVIMLSGSYSRYSGRVNEKIELTYPMTSLILAEEANFSLHTLKYLKFWIDLQRRDLESAKKWSLGPKKKKIDNALERLRQCYEELDMKLSSNKALQQTWHACRSALTGP